VAGNIPGKTSTLSVSIYSEIQLGHDGEAFRLLAVSVVLAFVAVWMSEWLFKRSTPPS
jgi:molybdate transport system permease protein